MLDQSLAYLVRSHCLIGMAFTCVALIDFARDGNGQLFVECIFLLSGLRRECTLAGLLRDMLDLRVALEIW